MITAKATHYGFVVVDQDQAMTETRFLPNGKKETHKVQIPGMTPDSHPLLGAAYQGDGQWDVNCSAGRQRFMGTKSSKEVAGALRRMGLDAKGLMAAARKVKGLVPMFGA